MFHIHFRAVIRKSNVRTSLVQIKTYLSSFKRDRFSRAVGSRRPSDAIVVFERTSDSDIETVVVGCWVVWMLLRRYWSSTSLQQTSLRVRVCVCSMPSYCVRVCVWWLQKKKKANLKISRNHLLIRAHSFSENGSSCGCRKILLCWVRFWGSVVNVMWCDKSSNKLKQNIKWRTMTMFKIVHVFLLCGCQQRISSVCQIWKTMQRKCVCECKYCNGFAKI